MDFLASATLLKADGSSVDSATALQGKVQRIVFYVLHFIHLDNIKNTIRDGGSTAPLMRS